MNSLFRCSGIKILVLLFLIFSSVMPLAAAAVSGGGNVPGVEKPSEEKESPPKDPLGRSTPHGTVIGFMREAGREDFARAVQYLDTTLPARTAQQLAMQLYAILNYGLSSDLAEISNENEGDVTDTIGRNREKVGEVQILSRIYPIILERVERDRNQVWLFSPQTLKSVPEMYRGIKQHDFEKYVPDALKEHKFLKYPVWKWIMFIIIIPLGFLFAWILTWTVMALARYVLRFKDGSGIFLLKGPVRILGLSAGFYIASLLSYSLLSRLFWSRVSETLLIIGATWLALKLIDPVVQKVWGHREATSGSIAVTRLLHKTARTVIVIIGFLFIMYLAGINITAVLTGLGIGGIAIAFAAQKTLENVFGGVMIVWDRPIRVGDFCKGDNYMGTVEDIGLRSTKLRTPERTVVSIPNGQLATMSLENFSVRDKILFHHKFYVRLETSARQIRIITSHIGKVLSLHPNLERDGSWVRFTGIKDAGLEIETWAYVLSTDYGLFQAIQEELVLHFMEIIEKAGTSLSFPSRTTYVTRANPVHKGEGDQA
ncbi:MAG: mechanosensitive ion channel family protein [Syntrophorhabdus sp.]